MKSNRAEVCNVFTLLRMYELKICSVCHCSYDYSVAQTLDHWSIVVHKIIFEFCLSSQLSKVKSNKRSNVFALLTRLQLTYFLSHPTANQEICDRWQIANVCVCTSKWHRIMDSNIRRLSAFEQIKLQTAFACKVKEYTVKHARVRT